MPVRRVQRPRRPRSAPELLPAFAAVVRDLRLEQDMSQQELALAVGVHATVISRVENGRGSPSLATIEALAKAFGIQPSELLRRAEAEASGTR